MALKIVILALAFIASVHGHGKMMRPPSRSSVWRVPEFSQFNPTPNWSDNELYCGALHQADDPGTNCGVCGDPISQAQPRDNERGGKYANGIITGRYTAGQVIDVEVDLNAAHLGNMEWRLCTDANRETQDCFNQHVLQRADGRGTKLAVDQGPNWYRTQLRLPAGVTCNPCVIQWNYRAGNNYGTCPDGSQALGCGPQETFRGCADVVIS